MSHARFQPSQLCLACVVAGLWCVGRTAWAEPASKAPAADDAAGAVYAPGARRDPFTPLVRDGKIVSNATGPSTSTSGAMGPLVLDGILWDRAGRSVALINGTEVKAGDRIGGYTVRAIRQDAVVLEQGSDTLVLQINFEAGPAPKKEGS